MKLRACLSLALLLGVTACGDLPEPFLGNPGATARRLAQPPAPRLVVPPPGNALLADEASRTLASDLVSALRAQKVPAFAQPAERYDWRLVATAESRPGAVVPVFTVVDPKGKSQGEAKGIPVPAHAWEDASAATLHAVAIDVAPRIANLLTRIETAREKADPNSLYNRPAKVMIAEVTGAPGDGDLSLTNQMRLRLAALGPVVQDTAKGADFTVQGHVRVVPIGHGKERVEIQWEIKDDQGRERGKVVQLNEIPAGSLKHYWGDVAVVVAAQASAGVNDVLNQQTGKEPMPGAQPAAVHGQDGKALVEGQRSGVETPVRQ